MIDIGARLLHDRVPRTDPAPAPRPATAVKRDGSNLLDGMVGGPAAKPPALRMRSEGGHVFIEDPALPPPRKSENELRRERYNALSAPVQRAALRGLNLSALELLDAICKEHRATGRSVQLDAKRCAGMVPNLSEREAGALLLGLQHYQLIYKDNLKLDVGWFVPAREIRD